MIRLDRALVLLALPLLASCTGGGSTGAPATAAADFVSVKPLLEHRCVWCHGNDKPLAGLNFQDRAAVLDPAARFVVPGDPARSRLYEAVDRDPMHMKVMPGDGWPITAAQKRALRDWIAAGAPWPEGPRGKVRRKDYRVELDDYL